jgi:hypothetical protein
MEWVKGRNKFRDVGGRGPFSSVADVPCPVGREGRPTSRGTRLTEINVMGKPC